MKYLAELQTYLVSLLKDCRSRRDVRTGLEVETLQDIAADAAREAESRRQTAFHARALDDEGLQLLARITAPSSPGGALIVRAELPLYQKAVRCFTRSRELDHELSEADTVASQSPAGAGPFPHPVRT